MNDPRGQKWPEPARRARQGFRDQTGSDPDRIAIAPGRVNLLGGHIDYNDGYVLPVAVDRYVAAAFAELRGEGQGEKQGQGRRLEFVSLDFDDRFAVDGGELARCGSEPDRFEALVGDGEHRWRRYAAGVAVEMAAAGIEVPAGVVVIAGNVPLGAGLSSSAALEGAVYLALSGGMATPEAASLCQEAENRWAGVPCGIMDQFASFMAAEGTALFLDCRDLTWRHIALPAGAAVTVIDSGVQRELATSGYRKRRQEIETALTILRKVAGPLPALRDLEPAVFEEVEDLLPEPLRSRVAHVVGGIVRVREGVTRLALGDAAGFGELMVACHRSLAENYEVSRPELDRIVELALGVDGVWGARLTGAGFGGCGVVLHQEECAPALRETVAAGFETDFGRPPEIHHLRTAGGAVVRPLQEAS